MLAGRVDYLFYLSHMHKDMELKITVKELQILRLMLREKGLSP